MAWKQHTTV